MRVTLLLCAAQFWCASAAWAQWPHVNDKVTRKTVVIRTALVMPPMVSFSRIGVKGSEGGVPESDRIADTFYVAVGQVLSARGVTVLPNPLGSSVTDAVRFAVSDMQTRFDNIAVQLRKKPDGVAKGRFTMGDGVTRFEPGATADVLIFLRGSGSAKTPGRTALGLATQGPAGMAPEFRSEVAFVDAKTGEVLVFFRFNRWWDMTKKADVRFSETLREWMHDIPLPTPPPKKTSG